MLRLPGWMVVAVLGLGGCSDGPTGPRRPGCPGAYPDQAMSPYVLPYRVGETYAVGQGNCSDGSHAPGTIVQYAYDFLMPVGTPVVVARAGEVILVEDRFEDGNRTPGEENFINLRHADETIAAYVHLTRNGALVAVGDTVAQGQVIGLSGDTGSSSEPHLHIHVQSCFGCPSTIPLTFRNTRPHPQGLVQGEAYLAEAF